VLLGLQATFHPFMAFPSYQAIAAAPLAERVRLMRDPAFKARLLAERSGKIAGADSNVPALADEFLANLDFVAMRLWRLGDDFDYEPQPQTSILAQAMARQVSPLEVIYDAMLEDDGRELLYFPIYNYVGMNLDVVHQMITHPLALAGLSDGGAHVGTVCDGSFPTYMLTHWARDRSRGPRLPLEQVVHMLTQRNAAWMGMADRGVVTPGLRADLNVIDFDALKLGRPYVVHDLPAGGQRLMQRAEGYRETLVGGRTVVAGGALTSQRPGRLVRAGR
jgi:N-acyl-D-aspartate/D-glutamate deacylase